MRSSTVWLIRCRRADGVARGGRAEAPPPLTWCARSRARQATQRLSIARASSTTLTWCFWTSAVFRLDPHAVDIWTADREAARAEPSVMVSHDLRKGFDMCTHALVLARGRVVTFGAK